MARMPQIPQTERGARPDGGVGRAVLPSGDGGAEALAQGAGALATAGAAADKDAATFQQGLDDALAAKQKIVDSVTSTRAAGDFEEKLSSLSTQMQKDYVDVPDKAPAAFLEASRGAADDAINAAPNSAVGLALAQKTASSINSSMVGMHTWAQGRMTQKAKSDLTVLSNQVVNGAAAQPDLKGLSNYLVIKKAALGEAYKGIHADPEAEWQKTASAATKNWFVSRGDLDPIAGLKALDAPKGPGIDNMDADTRDSVRKSLQQSLVGFGKEQNFKVVVANVKGIQGLYDAHLDGSLDSKTLDSVQNANALQQAATKIDPKLTPEQREANLGQLQQTSQAIDALAKIHREGLHYDGTDDSATLGKLLQDRKDLFKTPEGENGNDLLRVADFQNRLLAAAADKKLSPGSFQTMFNSVSLDMPEALTAEGNNTGSFWHTQTPREAGNEAMNKSPDFMHLDPDAQSRARIMYMGMLNDAMKTGGDTGTKSVTAMAINAVKLAGAK